MSSLAQHAPCPVRVVAPPERLPAVIETAVYFMCAEALTNVGKYARASRVDMEVHVEVDQVTVLVTDDGIGGADTSGGSGLEGVADRIEALGGRLVVESPRGVARDCWPRSRSRGEILSVPPYRGSNTGAPSRRPAARASPRCRSARIVPGRSLRSSREPPRRPSRT